MLIKFALRRNLIYPLQYLIWSVLRDFESELISSLLDFNGIIYTHLMFLGELLGGLIFYLYQKSFFKKKKETQKSSLFPIELIESKQNFIKDKKLKIIFIIFSIGFYDFFQFLLVFPIDKFMTISGSLEKRLRGTYTIYTALFYYYISRVPIYKHQLFSLISIGICLLIVIITENIFQEFNIFLSYSEFILALFLSFLIQFLCCLEQSLEKYLFEYNKLNPFLVLMIEGIFGFIFSIIYSLFYNPFNDIIKFKKNNSTFKYIILIIAFIVYIILSGGKNLFRVITTKIYSPMTSTFIVYFLNPVYLIYYFVSEKDFFSYDKPIYSYFFINLIISLITTFLGCVYNEFIILFCCELERDTHSQIVKRANESLDPNDDDLDSVSSGYIIPLQNME